FINQHLELAAAEGSQDDTFWRWLIDRDDDYRRQPSTSELLDKVLYFVDGRSLKTGAPGLWQKFQELRRTRNHLVHEGYVRDLTPTRAAELVRSAREVIEWIGESPR